MTPRARLPLLALLWLLTAAGAGLLFAWLLREGPGKEVRVLYVEGARGPGAADDAALPPVPAPHPAPGAPPAGRGEGPAPAPPVEGEAAPARRPPPPASVLVTVVDADGSTPEDGVVYALGAGEEGCDEEEFAFTAYLEEPGPVRLRLPSAGAYDVGFRNGRGATLVRDVVLAPGDGNELLLRVPAGQPVRVRIEGEWPPAGSEEAALLVDFWTEDSPRGQVEFPGRDDAGWASGFAEVAGAEGFSGPLQPGRSYALSGHVVERRPCWEDNDPAGRTRRQVQASPRFVAEADRGEVRPGETVTFRVRPRGALVLTAAGVLPPAEGKGDRNLLLFLQVLRDGAPAGAAAFSILRDRGGPPGFTAPGVVLGVEPGTLSVRWSGVQLQAGSLEGIEVGAGEFVEVGIPIRLDPAGEVSQQAAPPSRGFPGEEPGEAEPPPLEVEVAGLPEEAEASLVTCFRDENGEWQEFEDTVFGEDGRAEVGGVWRTAPEVAALCPPRLASPFVPVPATGPLRLELQPAGLLLVAPEEVPEEGFGVLRIRRADGRPVPCTDDGGLTYSWMSREVEVWPGEILGPFPEGSLVFEVRLGGLRLPDVRATVRAGKVGILRITR